MSCWLRSVIVVVAKAIAIVPTAASSAVDQVATIRQLCTRTQSDAGMSARRKVRRSQTMTVTTTRKTPASRSATREFTQSLVSFQNKVVQETATDPDNEDPHRFLDTVTAVDQRQEVPDEPAQPGPGEQGPRGSSQEAEDGVTSA